MSIAPLNRKYTSRGVHTTTLDPVSATEIFNFVEWEKVDIASDLAQKFSLCTTWYTPDTCGLDQKFWSYCDKCNQCDRGDETGTAQFHKTSQTKKMGEREEVILSWTN